MHTLAQRPTYSREQLERYVQKANNNNPDYTLAKLEAEIKADPLKSLADLQRKQIACNPWGNIAMHYSYHGVLSLDSEILFKKIVDRGHGGYCMENNSFFSNVLRSLGYQLYITGARISNMVEMNGKDPEGFAGWEHEIILVTIEGQKYVVDVGFGSQGALSPIPLKEGALVAGVPGNEVRIVRRSIAQFTDPTQQMWVQEIRNSTSNVWAAAYCFTELEWIPEDFKSLNYRTSNDPHSWFTYTMVLTKTILDEKLENAVGTVTLMGNVVTRRMGAGASEVLIECKNDQERAEALDKYFGVKLLPEEVSGVAGRAVQIKGGPMNV